MLSLFCQCFPEDADPDAAADAAIARFAEACPEFPDRIVDRLALGPRQLEERFGITGGHIFHGEMLPGQLLEQRPGPRRFGGIEGLYLCGSGAHPGGAVTGAPGQLAAQAAIEDLARLASVFVTRRLPGRRARPAARPSTTWRSGQSRLPPPARELRERGRGRRGAAHACSPTPSTRA